MVKRISGGRASYRARTRRAMIRAFLRWLCYAAVLLVFYLWEVAPLIRGWCPLLIIPLATAVAMREGELAAGVFGVFCGLMLDIASGTIPGFTSLWLLLCCPMISLLSRFWLKSNWISHFVMNAATTVIIGGLDFLFLHWVWEREASGISFLHSLLPAYAWSLVFSIPVYFLVVFISNRFRPKEERRLEEAAAKSAAEDDITKGSEK
ncbi:MAG: hypothetical protein ACI4WS_14065 [Oscillospiraceae bacterium]